MCGIAGSIFGVNQHAAEILESLRHRGPDVQQVHVADHVTFYHTRLSIQDLSAKADQPMCKDDLVIIFNGEIYNHKELRNKYSLSCETQSDTETILRLYQKVGLSFLDEMDGMFAIAIYDKAKGKVIIIRDRAGKKPLYYFYDGGQMFFASELNTLKKVCPLEIEEQHFASYVRLGYFFRHQTPYRNVSELLGGSYIEFDIESRKVRETKWWDIKEFYQKPVIISEGEALQQLKSLLTTAVQRRIESSDLEVGCFLSGGIDSGVVAALATRIKPDLKTFTVTFDGAYNEGPLARLVADKIGSKHTEIPIHFDDLSTNVEQIISNYGEPFFDSSAIPTWYVSKEAKKHVTVILNGDGADELFAGYRRYVPFAKYDFFDSSSSIRKIAGTLIKVLPIAHQKKSLYNYLYRLVDLAKFSKSGLYYSAGSDVIEGFTKDALHNHEENELVDRFISDNIVGVKGGLNKLMLLDFKINLFGDLLVKMDIGTMAHAIEGRSPFLCKELLEWVPTLPPHLKISGTTTKYLLRKFSSELLPGELVNQPKRGFEIPLKNWVNDNLKELIGSYLHNADNIYTRFYKKDFVEKLFNNKIPISGEKRAKILWQIFCMEVWYKKVYKC